MILPSSLSVINAVFVGKDRAIAFAVWGGTIGGMAALGPLLGGWLTTYASWHWAFLINVPIGIIVLVGVLLTVPETKETAAARRASTSSARSSSRAGLFGLVFALIEGQRYGWITPHGDASPRRAGPGRRRRSPSSPSALVLAVSPRRVRRPRAAPGRGGKVVVRRPRAVPHPHLRRRQRRRRSS